MKRIMGEKEIARAIEQISEEVLRGNSGRDLAVIGIYTRGAYLAQRIAQYLERKEGRKPEIGFLDITLYRDDLSDLSPQPILRKTEIDFEVRGKRIVLVDDVLFTGRTVRSALDAISDFGRAEKIELAVLVDRGLRELPISPTYVGTYISTSLQERIEVRLKEVDGVEEVVLIKKGEEWKAEVGKEKTC
ncbi:MAG: bifunctional pyr operon transcriptional regulator/uracil phosphoribosyltransferase PyrR [Candidatus Omnitrophota bacterium]|nr:MAG: bifunctional pyr operon transcriptional regulator/uracil phosphoribosyltransferase PyrR [Candidatus Omnitrophota bacterium]